MNTKSAESVLNQLLTRNYDAEKGYEQVAAKVEDNDLKILLENNHSERYRFGHEIKQIEADYGIEPNKGSSNLADAHRAWINIKDRFTGSGSKEVIEEAIRGEDYAINDYKEAIDSEALKPDHKKILSNHLKAIKNSREQLERLEAAL